MATSIAFLFPGQGAYTETVFAALRNEGGKVAETWAEIDGVAAEAAGTAISPLAFRDDPPPLEQLAEEEPDLLHYALYGISLGIYHMLSASGLRPSVLAGHSFGEIAALTAGGAFTVRDGARVIAARNAALRRVTGLGGMLAVRADVRRTSALVEAVADPGLVVAVENSPRQTVVSGPHEALLRTAETARVLGIGTAGISTAYPFHNRLLAGAAADFRDSLRGLVQWPIRLPVYSPILDRYYSDDDEVLTLLAGHLTRRARFLGGLRRIHAAGTDMFVECGARDALTKIVRSTLPGVTAVAAADGGDAPLRELAGAAGRLSRRPPAAAAMGGPLPGTVPGTNVSTPVPVTGIVSANGSQPAATGRSAPQDREQLMSDLVALYAEAVEYPHEVFTPDAELEADLGIDSLKQTEMLARVAEKYGLPPPGDAFRVSDYGTLDRIAELITSHGDGFTSSRADEAVRGPVTLWGDGDV